MNLGQGEIIWRTDCSSGEEGRQLDHRAEEERKKSHVRGSVSHFLKTKTKSRRNRCIYELESYRGLTAGCPFSILSLGLKREIRNVYRYVREIGYLTSLKELLINTAFQRCIHICCFLLFIYFIFIFLSLKHLLLPLKNI